MSAKSGTVAPSRIDSTDQMTKINPAKKETPHSFFKGQQLENKSLYRFVFQMSFLKKSLSYKLTLSL